VKFLVVEKGTGEGCDYTIGCNMSYDIVESDDSIEVLAARLAEDAVFHGEKDDYECRRVSSHTENSIRELIVVPMDNAVIPDLTKIRREHNTRVTKLLAERRKADDERRKADEEAKDKAEFERLKKKFGN
jgi:hypothetical protein